jgi:hypothetical protein
MASTLVLVAFVGGCAVLNNWHHQGADGLGCSAVSDWQSAITDAQSSNVQLDYPGALPSGWQVTSAVWDNDPDSGVPRWQVGTHNSDCSQFAGLIEEKATSRSLGSVVGSGEVSKTFAGKQGMTIVAHATSQAALDQFIASLTTAKLKP